MAGRDHVLSGARVFECAPDGAPLRSFRDAVDVIGASFEHRPHWIAIPVSRLGADFFRLRTRIAGEMLQKFVDYGLRVAIVGDISRFAAESEALRDFVHEANRGRQIWFVASLDELAHRLVAAGGSSSEPPATR